MAWFRLPRSIRTYLIIGLFITLAVLFFSTNNMLRVDASNPRSSFQFLITNDKLNTSTTIPSGTSANFNQGSHQIQSTPHNDDDSKYSDIHTTSAGSAGSITSSSSSPSSSSSSLLTGRDSNNYYSSSSKEPETLSDTIVISPLQKTSNLLGEANPRGESTNNTRTLHRLQLTSTNSDTYFPPMNSTTAQGRSMRTLSAQERELANTRRNKIRDMMKHAWHGYAKYAWGFNELRPVSKMPHTDSIFGHEKIGASIVDAIDTLYIMDLRDEYLAAREWIENHLDFTQHDIDLSVFETNIRYVGGLLSIYALTKDQMFLKKAVQIADILLPAFDTPSGVPYSNVNLKSGFARNHDWAHGAAILSEFGSMHLEFIYLSHVTKDPKYQEKAMRIRDVIRRAVPRSDGLYNNYMNTDTGQWLTRPTHISMGALGDSFYEYLIKAYVQTDGLDEEGYHMYFDAIRAFENKLMFTSIQSGLVYFAELKDTSINYKMDSLACFSGGMLALGASKANESSLRSRHFNLATGIANTCHESCIRTESHLGPETFVFSNKVEAVAFGPSEKYYILRPEILETYFYMWRYTHDPKYRSWAWDFVEALERHCKAEGGYSGLRNVYQPVIKDDVQQSFFLAEVLKYLYLTFTEDNLISLDDWVFNTEAHPLPILKRI